MKQMRLYVLLLACAAGALAVGCREESRDYRQDMRVFIQRMAAYAEARMPEFIIIPQNGEALAALDDAPDAEPALEYLAAIDGQGREDLLFGYEADNAPTPEAERDWMRAYLLVEEAQGVEVLATDYCHSPEHAAFSYAENERWGFISFAAPSRELDVIPASAPYGAHAGDVSTLAEARNFLYLLNPERYPDRQNYLAALDASDYDVFILDAFHGEDMLTPEETALLKSKPNGARRLVIAYLSIGEAEDYRYYWQSDWRPGDPGWLDHENPNWAGNYKVRYWDANWQAIIFGSENAYLDRILAAGFDGAYLDLVDAYEYFE